MAGAICVTAAHVFTEIRRIQSPPQRHVPSALPEFLPPARTIDLSRKKIRAIAIERDRAEALVVDAAVIDEARDTAVFKVVLQNDDVPDFFPTEFEVDDNVPAEGALICVLSYGELSTFDFETDGAMKRQFKVARKPVLRVGRVVASYPKGHRLCRGPCIETTVPVYSGMSGGPVFAFGSSGAPIRPFGLVCCDPDLDGPLKQDRSRAGSSIISLLPCQVTTNEHGERVAGFEFVNAETAGLFASLGKEANSR
ncbi:serine protease [Achromobacter mucicolens]|uniref:trypsin-like peptidase domain-containing protein n=1 Tax=Achromobacter mucicolens TaxID=1389922 RepID=UPI0020A2AC08|nr:serine protease [Achromobacter mucicolens]